MAKDAGPEVAKLRVKIGAHEFEAEGSHQVVATHFEAWKQLLGQQQLGNGAAPAAAPAAVPPPAGDPRDLFTADFRHRLITLRVPAGGQVPDADVALVILYGYCQCFGAEGREVPVTRLKQALTRSGHPCERIDRTLAGHVTAQLLKKRGQRKGTAYALTPAGYQRADSMARRWLLPPPG